MSSNLIYSSFWLVLQ